MSNLVTQESYDLFTYYVALKQHFTKPDYDFFKYGGKIGLTSAALEKRKDKSFFYSISKKKRNPKGYVFANILNDPTVWIGDIATNENSDQVFNGWERRMQSLSYTFKEEIGKLDFDFDANFLCKDGRHPPLLRLYLQKKVSLETVVILDMVLKFVRHWDKSMPSDPIWTGISSKIKKYKPFLSIDLDKFKSILKERFVE